ncbi:MAG: ABC transporter ATP-binding protein [Candidatus Riflebacteria bacterium]
MLFRIENLKKIYARRTVLDINDLCIETGNFYCLTGPNGSGKSTLLSILGLLEYPDEGKLQFQETPVFFEENCLRNLRLKIGFVEQQPLLFDMTVRQNLELPLKFRSMAKALREERVLNLLEKFDLANLAEAFGPNLSGGETRRVALARAIIHEPEVLLLDEPMANVDRQHITAIEKMLEAYLKKNGHTIIMATHDLEQAKRLSDRQIRLESGRLAQL